jgi:hypothetical protein
MNPGNIKSDKTDIIIYISEAAAKHSLAPNISVSYTYFVIRRARLYCPRPE